MSLSRRSVIRGLAAAGAAGLTSNLWMPGVARAAGAAPVFPTIFIRLRGGWDPVQNFAARTGLVNRNVSAANMKTTKAGVTYFVPTVGVLADHLEDAVVIRNVYMPGTDHNLGANILWYGALAGQKTRPSWANYLASKLIERQPVAAPNVTAYWIYNDDGTYENDFVNYNNKSPNPLGAVQRLLSLDGFSRTLDVSNGMPTPARQQRVYQFIKDFDAAQYNEKVQAKLIDPYDKASQQANDLVGRSIGQVWPPDAATMTKFNATAAELTRIGFRGVPNFKAMCLFAYQAARAQASHVISFDIDEGLTAYDTHTNNINGQLAAANRYMGPINSLLSALKATPSPVLPGKTMFDTTHVVIASEMGRSPNAEKGTGTFHWAWQHVVLFGGNFKRGYAFGELNAGLNGVAANFDTGVIGGTTNPTFMNVAATILKANGVDPTGWDAAPPINAVLQQPVA